MNSIEILLGLVVPGQTLHFVHTYSSPKGATMDGYRVLIAILEKDALPYVRDVTRFVGDITGTYREKYQEIRIGGYNYCKPDHITDLLNNKIGEGWNLKYE